MKYFLTLIPTLILANSILAEDRVADPKRIEPSGKYQLADETGKPKPEPEPPKVEKLGEGKFRLGQIEIDSIKRQMVIPVALAITEGNLEYALVHSDGKTHESLLVTDVHPTQLHVAALLLSAKTDTMLDAHVSWNVNGPPQSIKLCELIQVSEPNEKPITWNYQARLLAGDKLAAASELSIFALINDPSSLIVQKLADDDNRDDIYKFKPNEKLPAKGLPLSLVLTFPALEK